uniref:SSD domain-containing protein n=1 Tax=Romanomermis culicivorax TaxID=13658 RepID=A0A915HW85_ROMCU
MKMSKNLLNGPIGVDNVFIFIAAWRKTSVLADVQQRMYGTFKEASVSIFVTAFTDALAFLVGTASNFPAVSNFCAFAFAAITLVFINQMTFFAGFIVVSGKRENQFRHCVTMRVMQNKAISILKEKQELQAGQHHRAEFTDEGISDHAAARFFRGPYTSILLNPFIQSAVVLSLYVYWFVSTISVWNVRVGIHPTELVGEAIPARKTLELFAEYFKNYSNNAYIWYTDLEDYQPSIDYTDQSVLFPTDIFYRVLVELIIVIVGNQLIIIALKIVVFISPFDFQFSAFFYDAVLNSYFDGYFDEMFMNRLKIDKQYHRLGNKFST